MNFLNALTALLLSLFLTFSATPSTAPQQTSNQTTAPTLAKAENSDTSRNWAGYMADKATFTGVSGTWTVPAIKDTSTPGADATWVGIGGVNSNDLIQAGTQATVDEGGNVTYGAFYEDLPHSSRPLSLLVRAGDTMAISVIKEKDTTWNIRIKNTTTNESVTLSVPYDSSLSSAEWIEEAPTGMHHVIPLDNFGKVYISRATAIRNGKEVSAQDARSRPIAMSSEVGGTLAEASVLGNDGKGFTVSRNVDPTAEDPQVQVVYMVPQSIPLLIGKHIFHFGY